MVYKKFLIATGLLLSFAGLQPSLAQTSAQRAMLPGNDSQICQVHVWQSRLYESSNGNAVGGLVGALIESAVNSSAPPKSVVEQLAQDLGDQQLEKIVKNIDWPRYVGARAVEVNLENNVVDKKAVRTLEKTQARNSSSTANCYIELYVEKQIHQGGMKTWLFSNFDVRRFDAGVYQYGHGQEFTHVTNFPSKNEATNANAVSEIQSGFSRNLTKFLDKKYVKRG